MAKGQNKQARSKRKSAPKSNSPRRKPLTPPAGEDLAVSKLKELEALLEQLPDVFERKFSQRLAPVLERQVLIKKRAPTRSGCAFDEAAGDKRNGLSTTQHASQHRFYWPQASTSSFDPLSEEHVDGQSPPMFRL